MALRASMKIRTTWLRRSSAYSVPLVVESRTDANETILNSNSLESVVPRFYKKLLNKESNFTNECWATWRKKILDEAGPCGNSIDYVILDICDQHDRPDAARDFVDFMRKYKLPLNRAIIIKYLHSYRNRESLTDEEEKEIIGLYEILRNECPNLDEISARRCVYALSLTKKWKEAEKLMQNLTTREPTVHGAIICAAFRNHQPELAWKYLLDMYPKFYPNKMICTRHVAYCLEVCKNKSKFVEAVERMFDYWYRYYVIPYWSQLHPYIQNTQRFNWVGKTFENKPKLNEKSKCDDVTVCPNCSNSLKMDITEAELLRLSDAVYRDYICATDSNITKEEISTFHRFLERNEPFDIVMDGLNVFYFANRDEERSDDKQERCRIGEKVLTEIVQTFVEQKKSVLVLARRHLLANLQCISQIASVWCLDNSSNDDAFLLHATMKIGLKAKLVSRDLMRNHECIIKDPAMQYLFRQWQWTHQIVFYSKSDDSLGLRVPSYGQPLPQKINNCWHIPYREMQSSNEFVPNGKWVCFRHVDDWEPN